MTTPKPPCWACGGKGRSGPHNMPCWCRAPEAKFISLENRPPHRCGQCGATWSKASGSHRCPDCGFDLDLGTRPKFVQAHAHVKGIVAGSPSPESEPEPEPKKINPEDWSDLNWSGGYI